MGEEVVMVRTFVANRNLNGFPFLEAAVNMELTPRG